MDTADQLHKPALDALCGLVHQAPLADSALNEPLTDDYSTARDRIFYFRADLPEGNGSA